MKTIKIAISGDFTKEEFETEYKKINKEFDEPKYELLNKFGTISLCSSGYKIKGVALADEVNGWYNFSTISRAMACALGDELTTKEVLDGDIGGYSIFLDACEKKWKINIDWNLTDSKHFRTQEKAELAAKLLNNYKGKIFGIQMEGNK